MSYAKRILRSLGRVGLPVGSALLIGLGCSSGGGGDDPTGAAGGAGAGGAADTEIALEAPKSLDQGWQFAIPPFEVPQGQEVQDCYFFQVPYDKTVNVNKITLAMNAGSHHMNVFRVRTQAGLQAVPGTVVHGGECWKSMNWKDWPLVAGNQLPGVNEWQLPEGVVHKFAPGEVLMVQTHYVNATTQKTPIGGKVAINFEIIPDDQVKAELGTAFATNQSIELCPGDKEKSFDTTCKVAPKNAVTVVAATGHFHSRGKQFSMAVYDPASGDHDTPFYESKAWDEPPFMRGLNVQVPAGGSVWYDCSYAAIKPDACGDPDKMCCYTFGPHVDTNEHCNAFIYYYPKNDTDQNCF